ncbi:MAG TPA: DUF2235 domain-containing protein [Kofleriaceae bacterium]|nr:DUF2235 domain-containing protein [Kofleriaceae bacterium]
MLPTASHQTETEVAHEAPPPTVEGAEAEAAEPTTAYTNNGAIPAPQAFAAGAPPATAGDKAFAATDHLKPDQREYYDQIRAKGIDGKRAQKLAGESRPLTQNDRDTVTAIQRKIATMKPKRIDDPKNPNLVQIEVAFDGTGDDREQMPNDTNPAVLDDAFEGPKQYQPGVATKRGNGFGTKVENDYEFATGAGMQARIDAAYNNLVAEVNSIKGGNPKAEVVLVVTGFSRGAAEARAFTNELNKRGIPVSSSKQPDGSFQQHYDTPHVGVMVLFDTVEMSANRNLDMGIPANVDNVLHITARDEHRTDFPLTKATDPKRPDDPRITEVAMPGSHADIGGGNPNAYSQLSEQMARQYMVNAGVEIKPEDPTQQVDVNDPNLRLHDTGGGLFGMKRPTFDSRNPK